VFLENDVVSKVSEMVKAQLYLGNPYALWIRAAIIFGAVFLLIMFIRIVFGSLHLQHIKTQIEKVTFKTFVFSNLSKLSFGVALFIATYPAILSLNMPHKIDQISKFIFILALFAQIFIWANNTLDLYSRKYLQTHPHTVTAMNVFSLMWKIGTFTIIFLAMLNQLGFNINALIAGLGIGGIAVAFALQNVLGDIFGSLAIVFDKPFKIGDVITIGDFTGRVIKVGLKTTRVLSVNGEQLIFSNTQLLKSTIQNFGNLQERRINMIIRVAYETPYDVLKKIPEILREAIFSKKNTSIDNILLKEFADSSINFEVSFFIRVTPETPWAEIQHEVNLEIVRVFEKNGISFAYPTRTDYTKSL
jgi:small-conductance mechanosensitive channel